MYLVFTLYAPFAAFGSVAVGEQRPSWDRPARSAIMGLIAAALGLARDDEAAHLALDRGYGFAVRTDAAGRMLADYHSAQVPRARREGAWPTRAAELAEAKLETVLTRRDMRTDAVHMVALWTLAAPPYPLDAIVGALKCPIWVLYAGRKSCALGLPLGPLLIEASDCAAAFAARVAGASEPERALRRVLSTEAGTIAMDADAADATGVARTERRRDRLASRRRWQFALRDEAILRNGPAR